MTLVEQQASEDVSRPIRVWRVGFLEKEGRFIVEYGADRVVIPGRPEAAQLIFGSKDAPTELLSAGGKAGKILREVLPIPLPWYGINFV